MANPYFKDGTLLRVGPRQEDPFLDQYVLNDDEVEITETAEGYARVRRAGDAEGDEMGCEGWVRLRNISRIERKAGLPDLGGIAQEAIDALGQQEQRVRELEDMLFAKDDMLTKLSDQVGMLRAELERKEKESDGLSGDTLAAPPWQPSVGDMGFMLNPMFADGTRLRTSAESSELNFSDDFVLNDAEVTILEIDSGFAKIRTTADNDVHGVAQMAVEGWVRVRNIQKTKRETGLGYLKKAVSFGGRLSFKEGEYPDEAEEEREAPAFLTEGEAGSTAADGEASASSPSIHSHADEAVREAAAKAIASRELAQELASWLKVALEKSNTRSIELFRDWDGGRGHVTSAEFAHGIQSLGVKHTDEELARVFEVWDHDGNGKLDYKELERAIKQGGSKLAARSKTSTAKDIQKALNERLKGQVNKKKEGTSIKTVRDVADKATGEKKRALARAKSSGGTSQSLTDGVGGADGTGEYEETGDEAEGTWAASKWLNSLNISKVITKALQIPSAQVKPAFDFVRALKDDEVKLRLEEAKLEGLYDVLSEGLVGLKTLKVSGSAQLNDKFQATGKFQMSYGSLSLFYGGLESLLGPPQMHKTSNADDAVATLLKAMENDHCAMSDSDIPFQTPNGATAKATLEWEFVFAPKVAEGIEYYPERDGLREAHPEWCRKPTPLPQLKELMEEKANSLLRKDGHSECMEEELLGGRLYTGPMYAKYNAVLRAKSKVPFLVSEWKRLCKDNNYVTTIHAINSCVIKLSKLTKACKVWRGIKDATLPPEFWVPNELGVRGGIEYGFSSTTTEKDQAVFYANVGAKVGDAMTIFEMRMGMVDRGADLSWLSQYPHEKEVLLPPLTGVEALGSDVEGNMLVIESRFSLNLAAQTLEQVLSRRRKMLMDMAYGIELDLREKLEDQDKVKLAIKILKQALLYGAYSYSPEWFNSDDNFTKVMNETLYLQRILVSEIKKLDTAMDKGELMLKSWKVRSPARIMLVCGWVFAKVADDKKTEITIDLRETELLPSEGVQLARLLADVPKLTALDVRGNETLGDEGVRALEQFMSTQKVKSSTSVAHSLCGITPAKSRLEIPHQMEPCDVRIVCSELENSVWAEGVSAAMGTKTKGASQLNRRGGSHQASDLWQPLIWASKENQMLVAEMLLDHGHDVNKQETTLDKSLAGYAPLHWAAQKGHMDMLQMLLSRGADVRVLDKHGNMPKALATKKGYAELVTVLEAAEKTAPKTGKAASGKSIAKPAPEPTTR